MSKWDLPIIGLGVVAIGGYVLLNPDILSGILPPPTNGQPPTEDDQNPQPDGNDKTDGGTGSASECKTLCSNADCKAYNKKCTAGCSKCKGGSGGGGGGGSGDGSYDCKKACTNCWCKSYSEKCSGKCSNCCGSSRLASKCGGKGVKSCGGGGGGSGGSGGGGGGGKEITSFVTYQDDLARISIA